VEQPGAAALDAAEDGVDAAGVVDVFDVIVAAGGDLADVGARLLKPSMRPMSYSMPASWATASMWSTVLVLPPMAMSRIIALSTDSAVTISRGKRPCPSPAS
jgi:hypothetical protein